METAVFLFSLFSHDILTFFLLSLFSGCSFFCHSFELSDRSVFLLVAVVFHCALVGDITLRVNFCVDPCLNLLLFS